MTLVADAVVEPRKQCVWIVRYGLTKFPLVEHLGPYNSPLDETEGLVHAQAIAQALCADVRQSTSSSSSSSSSVHVYSSPFTRTTQTAHIIATALSTKVFVEEGLTEWQQASLLVDPSQKVTYPPTAMELVGDFPTVDVTYHSVNPQDSCHPQEATSQDEVVLVEESEQDLFERCTKTLEGILHHQEAQQQQQQQQHSNSFIVVSHAPCDQAMAVYLEGTTLDESTLPPWPLGGITKFSRVVTPTSLGPWKMDAYGSTDHMPGDYKGGLKAWSLPILAAKKK